jgi:hypothetical protein
MMNDAQRADDHDHGGGNGHPCPDSKAKVGSASQTWIRIRVSQHRQYRCIERRWTYVVQSRWGQDHGIIQRRAVGQGQGTDYTGQFMPVGLALHAAVDVGT